jgi:hypothetical protein
MHLNNHKADSLGIVSSLLCLIHCLLLPVLILAGIISEDLGEHTQWVDYVFILLAASAVFFATRQMANPFLKTSMWIAAAWFALSIMLHELSPIALYSSMLSSVALVVLHTINFRQHHVNHHTEKTTA